MRQGEGEEAQISTHARRHREYAAARIARVAMQDPQTLWEEGLLPSVRRFRPASTSEHANGSGSTLSPGMSAMATAFLSRWSREEINAFLRYCDEAEQSWSTVCAGTDAAALCVLRFQEVV
jgi:hypothetical protein